jgi:hypothetical protein
METIPWCSGRVRICRKLAIGSPSSAENKARTPNTSRLTSDISDHININKKKHLPEEIGIIPNLAKKTY